MPGLVQANTSTGIREDLSDLLFEFDAQETPYFSAVRKEGFGGNQIAEWPLDTPSRRGSRGKPDGEATTFTQNQSQGYAIAEMNYMWVEEPVSVGKKAQNQNRAGVDSLFEREKLKAMANLKERIDRILCDDTDQRNETGVTGAETRGLGSAISSTAQGVRPIPAAFLTPAGAIKTTAWTTIDDGTELEEDIGDIAEAIFLETGQAQREYVALVGIAFKRALAKLAILQPAAAATHVSVRHFNGQADERKLMAVVDMLETDGGTFNLMLSRNLGWSRDYTADTAISDATKRRAYFLNMPDAVVKMQQNVEYEELPSDGGGRRGRVDAIFAHCVTPKRMGKFVPA